MKNDLIELASETVERDKDGFRIPTEHFYQCFADVEDVRRNEFYAAANAGFNVSLYATINYADYRAAIDTLGKKPKKVRYDGDLYRIIRQYRPKKDNDIHLTLAEVE